MSGEIIGSLILWLVVAIVAIAVVAYLLHWLYHRSSREIAFVRTGLGGEKVVINSGTLVLPIIHEVTYVNLNVVRIPVDLSRESSVISNDRMRVDVTVEFFVRVIQEPQAVSAAASTLGKRTMDPDRLTELLSGKFVGVLRSVVSELTLDEMHENRGDMLTTVEQRARAALAQNGLEIESVAMTDLNQTDLEYFNPANRFDAEGMTKLIETIESRRKLRNDIEQSSMVAIRSRNLEAEKEALKLEQESEDSRLTQELEIESMRAKQRSLIQKTRFSKEAEAEQTRIDTEHVTREKEIQSDRQLKEIRIQADEEIETRDIARGREVESARIEASKIVETARIEQDQALETARVGSETAKAQAAKAEERVKTAREKEITERAAMVDTLLATKEAETTKIAAEAQRITATVAAEAQKLKYEAENVLSDTARAGLLRDKLLDRMEGIIRESAKPMERIDGIKILHVDGLGNTGDKQRSPTDEVMDSVLRYRVQAPLIDEMMKEVGIENPNVAKGMGDIFRTAKDAKSVIQGSKNTKDSTNSSEK